MAGNFLDDVAGFLHEMAASDPVPALSPARGEHAGKPMLAYHDMAGLFGFANPTDAYAPSAARSMARPVMPTAFGDFAQRLKRLSFHGEHPTACTWFHYQPALDSVQPARTVYNRQLRFPSPQCN